MGMLPPLAEISGSEALTQIARFWSFQDPSVRTALAGVLLLSASCGTIGCFILLRRMSLMGDSLGHAVLPGVCLGFLVTKTKDLRWIFLGAVVSALLGSWLIGLIGRRSRLKPDACMGLVLSGFFGLGTVLLTRLQQFPYGNQSGLNQFLFGQASAIGEKDLWLMGVLSVVIIGSIGLAFKEFTLTSFDEGFASAIGLPTRGLHYVLMGLVALAIVVSLQAVGVVLLSAMLITPAATAYLLTDRLRVMVLLSVMFGCLAGVIGLNLSFLGRSLPTGPFIVLVLTLLFATAYLFSPRYGVLTRAVRSRRQAQRIQRENVIKSIYLALQQDGNEPASGDSREKTRAHPSAPLCSASLSVERLAAWRHESPAQTARLLKSLVRHRLIERTGGTLRLTERGVQRAQELDRNYRLWEQFLTREVNLPLDHTARDAEQIEHILDPALVKELEAHIDQHSGQAPVAARSPLPAAPPVEPAASQDHAQ